MMWIVAKDGSGDFTTVQAAVDACPEVPGRAPALILILAGEYRERVVVNRSNIRLVGEDREKTVITWSACAKDRFPDRKSVV